MNVPNESLDKVLELLPGMKSLTIMLLAISGWHSVHTVISVKHLWEIIGKLKSAGADGILALSIGEMTL